MLRLHSKDVLTLVVICYVAVTVIGLRFRPRKIIEQSTSQMELIGQPTSNTSQSPNSNTSSWTHEQSAVVVDNLPTKRQTQSADVDNPEESLFDIFHDKPIKEEFITNKDNAGPAYRRVIIIPNTANALRIPHPYPFHTVRFFDPVIDPVRFIPSPLHIHHYRRVPVPVEVPKYQHIPQPYYVPYKPKPDYTVTDVQVYDPVNPCLNGGLPLASQFGYHCLCSKDYHGRFCDAKLYCSSSPCQNGGVCEEKENNYQCQCKDGYLGYNCEDKNLCRPNPCKNDGQCVETSTSYRCYCRPGFIGKACENLDYCDPNPCQNGGSCQQRMGFHECICHEQYKGKLCEQKRVCYSNPCKNGGKCVEDDPRFNCLCPHGYMLPHCKVHVCESNPCLNGGKCVPRKEDGYRWTYHCICSLLFKGDKCEIPNPCVTNPCLHGGSCIDSYSKYTGFPKDWNIGYLHYYCLCPPEYSGQKCEDNLCLKCDVNAFCNHGRCVCNEGFRGDGFKCNATEDPCIPNPCLNNGTCSNGPDESFDCTCPEGYFPPLCTKPFDHCIPNPCKNGGTCVKDGDSFHCICPVDYLLPDCANKTVNPCIPNPCQNKATCQPTEDKKSFTCNCKGNFKPPLCACDCPKGNPAWIPPILSQKCTESGDCYCPQYSGKTYSLTEQGCVEATKRNPCESNPCKNGGQCFTSQDELSFTCQCPEECTGDLCQNCDPDKICPSGYCKNGGTCIIVGLKPFCKCPSGYLPPECAKKVPENRHVCHPNPCQNGGTCRKVLAEAYECSCLVQFHGKHCERDKCMDCDVHASCHNGRCRCRRGYKGTGLKGDCKQELVCHTCPLNAVCVDGECSCIKGFYFIDNICEIEDGG